MSVLDNTYCKQNCKYLGYKQSKLRQVFFCKGLKKKLNWFFTVGSTALLKGWHVFRNKNCPCPTAGGIQQVNAVWNKEIDNV
jgi:hypothetical protein